MEGRCSSCGSPTSVVSAEHVVLIEPTRIGGRPGGPKSPVQCRGAGPVGPQCRRCSEDWAASHHESPKVIRRSLNGAARRAEPPCLAGRLRRFLLLAVAVLLSLHLMLCTVLATREWRARWVPGEPTASAPAPDAAPAIPKIIHQMYKDTVLPDKWADVPAAWARLHPPGEYTYRLWTDEELRELIAADYPWLLATYDAYPYATQRWDASRYAVLHKYGGLYADLDLHPVTTVDAMLHGQTLLLPHTPNIGLTNAVMASTAGHPFMAHALRDGICLKSRSSWPLG